MDRVWEEGFSIAVRSCDGTVIISANREGLISLARHMTALADETPGSHIHLDQYNALEDGSRELVIELLAADRTSGLS